MIGRIKGSLLEKELPNILIDVVGVGYELQVSMYTFFRLPDIGSDVTLLTHLIVREDAQILCGFTTREERDLFRALIKVSGIGPKSALAILSSTEPNEFVRSVLVNDTAGLTRLPGIGKKTAQRLIIEMRDRLSDWGLNGVSLGDMQEGEVSLGDKNQEGFMATKDAISALIALGYKPQDARRSIMQNKKPGLSSEDLIRNALRELGNKD